MLLVGMGTQIVEVVRIRQLIDRHADRFLDRVFTPDEQAYCRDRVRTAEHFAARWAAKEATLRSLGTTWDRTIPWTDMAIDLTKAQEPQVGLAGVVAALARANGVTRFVAALAQTRAHATATILALRA